MVGEQWDGVREHRCVEVHRDLDGEDDGKNLPFAPRRPRVAEDVEGVVLGELTLAVWAEVAVRVWGLGGMEIFRVFDGGPRLVLRVSLGLLQSCCL